MSDYDYDGEEENDEPIQWRSLNPKERLELMKNIFTNSEWYDGTPFSEGGMPMADGSHNPDFQAIVDRSGAPMKEAKRYYAAWLQKQGLDPKTALEYAKDTSVAASAAAVGVGMTSTTSQGFGSMSTPVAGTTMPMPQLMQPSTPPAPPAGGNSDMWAMMQFMIQQQQNQSNMQQFQMQMQMEQRRLDELRNAEMRREQMARDQQFMNQQTTLLRESFKRANDTGFGGKLMEAAQEKMIEDMIGGKDESWRDSIKDVLGSDTLKEAVVGLGGALGARRQTQIPAGYDDSQYNPYAQPIPQGPPAHLPPSPQQTMPQPMPQHLGGGEHYSDLEDQPTDGVFFEEQPPAPQQMQQAPTDLSRDEYTRVLFESFSQLLGPQMQDPQVTKAVQEQIEVAVDVTMLEMPEAIPQLKLQAMSEKMLLVRNLRDICFGLRDLRGRVNPGEQPSGIILAAVISELRKRPEFYKIFSDNSYEEVIAQLEPFKDTGAIKFDYEYLIRPEIAEIARHLLGAVSNDKMSNGIPQ
jgi:hypothetical protein